MAGIDFCLRRRLRDTRRGCRPEAAEVAGTEFDTALEELLPTGVGRVAGIGTGSIFDDVEAAAAAGIGSERGLAVVGMGSGSGRGA